MSPAHWDTTLSLPKTSIMDIGAFAPFVEGLDHPEGVASGPDGTVYAGGEAGQIYRVSFDGTFEQVGSTGGFVLGICLDANSNVYACDSASHSVKRITIDGHVSTYSNGTPSRPMQTPNYPVFDKAGRLYVSDSGEWDKHSGCVFRIDPDGSTELLTEAINVFPNGLALHPTGSHLYAVVSQVPGVVRISLDDTGTPGQIETVIGLPHNVPDGLAFDVNDNLYISCYAPDIIYRLTPDGDLQVLVSDWTRVTLASPTNLAFCGDDRKTLVVGSLCRWHLSSASMDVAGAPLHFPVF
ncbi:hypothetical protein BH23CHL5_BH23CHL5_04850 [soil metagenome]